MGVEARVAAVIVQWVSVSASCDGETGKPRHVHDSRVMSVTLRAEDAVPAATPVDAKMHMQVVDKMLAKKRSLREIFVKMTRDKEGRVPVQALRDEYVCHSAGAGPAGWLPAVN